MNSFGKRPVALAALPEAMPQHRQPREIVTFIQAAIVVAAIAAALTAYMFDRGPFRPTASGTGSATDGLTISKAVEGIPNVSIEYYDIHATDIDGIRKELRAKGPQSDGERFDAYTRWRIDWRWGNGGDGECGVANAQVMFTANTTFPRLARPEALTPEAAQHWRSFAGALARHEASHVRNAYNYQEKVLNAVRSADCDTANAVGHRLLAELKQIQAEYDRETNHGSREGVILRRE